MTELKLPPDTARHKGCVKWFDKAKRFGFIMPDQADLNDGRDVFLHLTQLTKSGLEDVIAGEWVEFALETFRGKQQATNITRIQKE